MEKFVEYFEPKVYTLDLNIDKEKKSIGGIVVVEGEVLDDVVKFHAVEMKIQKVTVNEKEWPFEYDKEVLLLKNMSKKLVRISIWYEGKLNKNMQGAYLSTYKHEGKTKTIVATQFESHYAREAFPCVDEPAAKAVFDLKLTMLDEKEEVVSNMPIINSEKKDEFVTVSFAPTPKMSTYLLAWVVGDFDAKQAKTKNGTLVVTYCAKNQSTNSVDFANETAVRALEFYEDNFGIKYPLPKLSQVALPDFEAGAMENWGLVTYRESMLLVSEDAALSTRKSVALTVAHELAHQWFGNLVTMEWWDDLWLNESFASIMEYYAIDEIYPEYKIFEGFFTGDACAALLRDAYTGVQSVHQEVKDPAEIATLFDGAIVYAKGARLMLMLIRLMGWKEFCKGILDYFEKYAYKNTVGDDLWMALQPYAGFEVKEFMHAFIDEPGYPVLTNLKNNFEEFSQKRFLLDGPMEKSEWPLPKITEDMSGHYVLNLSEEEFNSRLAGFDKLELEEKLRLLIDRDLVTKAKLQSAASLVPLAMRFKTESASAIWNKISALVVNLRTYFDDESEEEKILKKYVFYLVDEKLNEVGLKTQDGDSENTIRLRTGLLGLDYFAEDKSRLKKLADMYDADYRKMDKEIRNHILSAKVFLTPKVVDEYLEKYKTVADPDVKFDYLAAACLTRDKEQLEKMLALLGNIEVVKPQDQLYLFVYLYRNPKSKKRVFEWLTKNWDLVQKTGGDKTLSDYPTLVARLARTEEELKLYEEFFGPMRENLALARAIQIGENEIRARIKLIQKNKEAVYKELVSCIEKSEKTDD